MNIPTIIIAALILGVVTAIIIKEIKNRKSGKSCSCGMSCETCGLCKK
ncbi:MAG: FeoB-associated Cys-rich membrane protein [Clostridia bacterium]|nr:FeoB-associated Cys-rich membrane protein [Clostridia bacterium]